MLKITKLNKSFLDKKNNKIEVLNNINIQFGNNGLYFIVGKSWGYRNNLSIDCN